MGLTKSLCDKAHKCKRGTPKSPTEQWKETRAAVQHYVTTPGCVPGMDRKIVSPRQEIRDSSEAYLRALNVLMASDYKQAGSATRAIGSTRVISAAVGELMSSGMRELDAWIPSWSAPSKKRRVPASEDVEPGPTPDELRETADLFWRASGKALEELRYAVRAGDDASILHHVALMIETVHALIGLAAEVYPGDLDL